MSIVDTILQSQNCRIEQELVVRREAEERFVRVSDIKTLIFEIDTLDSLIENANKTDEDKYDVLGQR